MALRLHKSKQSPKQSTKQPAKKRTPSQVGRLSRTKGQVFERDVVKRLQAAGFTSTRGWWQATGGSVVPDVILDGFWLELSTGSTVCPLSKLKQAQRNARGVTPPPIAVAITRLMYARNIDVTLTAESLATLVGATEIPDHPGRAIACAIDFRDFITLLQRKKINVHSASGTQPNHNRRRRHQGSGRGDADPGARTEVANAPSELPVHGIDGPEEGQEEQAREAGETRG